MSNLTLVVPGGGTPEQNEFLAKTPPINLFKGLAHAPKVGWAVAQLGGVLLYDIHLDGRLRELAILQAAHCAGCAYEVVHHERIARDVGLTEPEIAAVRPDGDLDALDREGRLVCKWARSAASGHPDPELASALIETFGEVLAVELVTTVGYYLMVAGVLNAFSIPLEIDASEGGVDVKVRPESLS